MPEYCGRCSGALVDAEATRGHGFDVILRQRGVQLLKEAGVESLTRDLRPKHLERSSSQYFLVAHHGLDLVLNGGDLIGQLCGIFDVTADYLLGLSAWRAPVVSNSDTEILAAYHAAPADIRAIIDTALAPYKEDAGAGAAASA